MARRYRVRPSPAASALGAVFGLIFLFGGCAMMNAGPIPLPGAFQLIWVLVCLGGIGMSLYNAVSETGIGTDVIQEDFTSSAEPDPGESHDTATLLQELESLRAKKLITDSEYQEKRQSVLARFD